MPALRPEIAESKAACAENSGAISKRGNAASADFKAQPFGPGLFLHISALFVAHLATVKPRFSRLERRKNNSRRGHI
jgi:hypothetical protein